MKRLCVFCGSSDGRGERYKRLAADFGRGLAARGVGVVYGGGRVGLMGALADAALAAGGEVIGVIPEDLVRKELAHNGVTKLHVVGSMHARKALMAELADGFVALPGGFGTLDEFCEILTWSQLGLHEKPCGVLDPDGYFAPFLSFVEHSVREGFIRAEHAELLMRFTTPTELLDAYAAYKPKHRVKWLHKP